MFTKLILNPEVGELIIPTVTIIVLVIMWTVINTVRKQIRNMEVIDNDEDNEELIASSDLHHHKNLTWL